MFGSAKGGGGIGGQTMALSFGCLKDVRPALAFKEGNLYRSFFCCNVSLLCFSVTLLLIRGCLEMHGIFISLMKAPQDVSSRYHTVRTQVANLNALIWGS